MQECEEFAFSFFRNDFLFKCEYYEEDCHEDEFLCLIYYNECMWNEDRGCWVEKIKEE